MYFDADKRKITDIHHINVLKNSLKLYKRGKKMWSLNGLSINQWYELWHKKVRVQVPAVKLTVSAKALPLSSLHKSVGQLTSPGAQAKTSSTILNYPSLSLPPVAIHPQSY